VTLQKLGHAVPTPRAAEAAGNTSDADMDQQRLIDLACGDSLPDVPLLDVPLPDVPLFDVPLPDVSLPDARPDSSVSED
jgi:hypothetical protein